MQSLTINRFRGFEELNLRDFGRVNLFVGKNNSGKSSILEAINLAKTSGDANAIWSSCFRRGEMINNEMVPGRVFHQEVDISHLFYSHEIKEGAYFNFITDSRDTTKVEIMPSTIRDNQQLMMFLQNDLEFQTSSKLQVRITNTNGLSPQAVPLTRNAGLRQDVLSMANNLRIGQVSSASFESPQYITTASLNPQELQSLWGGIVLTPFEDDVISALKVLDENIERIAAVNAPVIIPGPSRGNFIVKAKGSAGPVPIGNYGDGVWRMLCLAIGVAKSRNNYFLVDEIDTGLHYSAMSSLWKIIFNAATEHNVQVFATTHSYDCVASLAEVAREYDTNSDIAVLRIEKNKREAVRYDNKQMLLAAENTVEVR